MPPSIHTAKAGGLDCTSIHPHQPESIIFRESLTPLSRRKGARVMEVIDFNAFPSLFLKEKGFLNF
jgi:hypothetical protein